MECYAQLGNSQVPPKTPFMWSDIQLSLFKETGVTPVGIFNFEILPKNNNSEQQAAEDHLTRRTKKIKGQVISRRDFCLRQGHMTTLFLGKNPADFKRSW